MIPSSIGREPERSRTDRADLYALLDEVPHGVLASVNDGSPWLVPMLFARDGDRILLHGSTGAGALRYVAAGEPVAFAVTSVDGIVVSYNTFHSSANYRSAVVNGVPQKLTGDEAWQALNTMSDRLVPGRTAEVRDMTKKEQASTPAIALPIEDGQWTMKGPRRRRGRTRGGDGRLDGRRGRPHHVRPRPARGVEHGPAAPRLGATSDRRRPYRTLTRWVMVWDRPGSST